MQKPCIIFAQNSTDLYGQLIAGEVHLQNSGNIYFRAAAAPVQNPVGYLPSILWSAEQSG